MAAGIRLHSRALRLAPRKPSPCLQADFKGGECPGRSAWSHGVSRQDPAGPRQTGTLKRERAPSWGVLDISAEEPEGRAHERQRSVRTASIEHAGRLQRPKRSREQRLGHSGSLRLSPATTRAQRAAGRQSGPPMLPATCRAVTRAPVTAQLPPPVHSAAYSARRRSPVRRSSIQQCKPAPRQAPTSNAWRRGKSPRAPFRPPGVASRPRCAAASACRRPAPAGHARCNRVLPARWGCRGRA